jgi:hypothetical protein
MAIRGSGSVMTVHQPLVQGATERRKPPRGPRQKRLRLLEQREAEKREFQQEITQLDGQLAQDKGAQKNNTPLTTRN